MAPEDIQISLTSADVMRLVDALDSHEYWQLGEVLPRNNGEVWIPGDLPEGEDRYWDGVSFSPEEQAAIDEVGACRALRDRLLSATPPPPQTGRTGLQAADDGAPT